MVLLVTKEKFNTWLRKKLPKIVDSGKEFSHLAKLCEWNGIEFDNDIINYALDSFLYWNCKGSTIKDSKYLSIFQTSLYIIKKSYEVENDCNC